MMARSKKSQSKHNIAVRKIANEYKKKGFDVKADVSGFPKPGTIGGYRPDVIAIKDKERKIVEVETSESVDSVRDKRQQQAFRNTAKRSKSTKFQRIVVK